MVRGPESFDMMELQIISARRLLARKTVRSVQLWHGSYSDLVIIRCTFEGRLRRPHCTALWQKWQRGQSYGELNIHRPRRLLLSFKGNIEPWEQVYWQHRWIASEYWEESGDLFVDVRCKINVQTKKNVPENHVHYKFPTDPESYGELLLNSTFVFAPGGGSVSSYRFTEALAAGVIPVVTSEYRPPFYPEDDWSGCLFRVVKPE